MHRVLCIKLKFNSILQYKSVLTQATTKLVVRTAVNLSFKIVGKGLIEPEKPPIFLLHGLFGCKKHWRTIGKIIWKMTRRTVAIVDLRNHGSSPQVSSHKYDEMALDMIQLLNKLGVLRASLVGQCIGGRMAMCVALTAPERVAGLLVVDISPVTTSEHLKDMSKIMLAMQAVDFKNPKRVGRAKKVAKLQLKHAIKDDIALCTVLSNIKVLSTGKIGWKCNLDGMIKQFSHISSFPTSMVGKKYNGPCLFIGGELSGYIPEDDLTQIKEMFPQAVITYIPKTGHYLHEEDPKSFLELAIAFLKSNK